MYVAAQRDQFLFLSREKLKLPERAMFASVKSRERQEKKRGFFWKH